MSGLLLTVADSECLKGDGGKKKKGPSAQWVMIPHHMQSRCPSSGQGAWPCVIFHTGNRSGHFSSVYSNMVACSRASQNVLFYRCAFIIQAVILSAAQKWNPRLSISVVRLENIRRWKIQFFMADARLCCTLYLQRWWLRRTAHRIGVKFIN